MFRLPPVIAALLVIGVAAPAVVGRPDLTQPDTTPGTPEDLAVGPVEAEVTWKPDPNGLAQKHSVTLLLLTTRECVFRHRTKGLIVARDKGPDGIATFVGIPKDKYLWEYTPDKVYVGKHRLPPKPLDITPSPMTLAQRTRYLLTLAESLQLSIDNALYLGDVKSGDDLVSHAAAVEAYLRRQGPAALAPLFQFSGYVRDQRVAQKTIREQLETLRTIRLDREAQIRAAQNDFNQSLFTAAFVGFGGYYLAQSEDDTVARSGVAAIGTGRDMSVFAAQRFARERNDAEFRATTYSREATAKLKQAEDQYRKNAEDRASRIAAAWTRETGLQADQMIRLTDVSRYLQKKDVAGLVAVLRKRVAVEEEAGYRNPILQAQLRQYEALLLNKPKSDREANQKAAAALHESGLELVSFARWIPEDELFDRDRVLVLSTAADLVHQAAAREADEAGKTWTGWSREYNPRADDGLRMANLALAFGRDLDPTGEVRATRAWLLLQRGRKDLALDQVQALETMSVPHPEFHYNRARVYGAHNLMFARQAEKAFADSVRYGLSDVKRAATDYDLIPVRANAKEWKYLTQPRLGLTFDAVQKGPNNFDVALQIRNESPFTMTDVKLTYALSGRVADIRLERLAPGGTYIWKGEASARGNTGSLAGTSDQGTISKIAPKVGSIQYNPRLFWSWY